jgi:expansin (peptidoglycan-binding protein)
MSGGSYSTACGYTGTESGFGQSAVDTVTNIATTSPANNTYFAAIPGQSSSNFNTVNDCGACVEITNGGSKVIATIVDECPTSGNPACTNGHLDLSTQAFDALHYSTGNPSGTTWKFIACPVTGNIKAIIKSGNANQVFFQNSIYPIVSVTGGTHLSYGAWQLNTSNAGGQTYRLTNSIGQYLDVTVPPGGGDTGRQFPSPGTCN